MSRRATIIDLARTAGVSVSTIDRVLNGRDPVRAATAAKVLAAAEAIGFYATPLLRARLRVDQPVQRLGFLLQQSNRTFYRLIAEALHTAAQTAGPQTEAVVEFMDVGVHTNLDDTLAVIGWTQSILGVAAGAVAAVRRAATR